MKIESGNFDSQDEAQQGADLVEGVQQEAETEVSKANLRGFSQLTEPELRIQIAREIKERRGLRKKLASQKGELNVRQEALNKIEENLDESQESLSLLSSNLAVRILNWKKRARLSEGLIEQQKIKESSQSGVSEQAEVVDELEEVLKGRKEVGKDKELLKDFYGKTKEKYIKSKEARQVENVMEKHGVTFVHGFSEYVPQQNSVLWEDGRVDFEAKLRILLALSPDISTSTVKKGDGRNRIWDESGVVLCGGEVKYASGGDAGTVATPGSGQRSNVDRGGYRDIHQEPEAVISQAINNRQNYNEFVVRPPDKNEPFVGGLYFFRDEKDRIVDKKYYDSLIEIGKRYDLPVYCLFDGELHNFSFERRMVHDRVSSYYDREYDFLLVGEKVDVKKMADAVKPLSESKKKKIFEGLFKDQPFDPDKLGLQEAVWMNESELGKHDFLDRQLLEKNDELPKAEYELWPGEHPDIANIPKGGKVHILAEHYINGRRNQYFTYNGEGFIRTYAKNTSPKSGEALVHVSNRSEHYKRYNYSWVSKEDYLTEKETEIARVLKMKQNPIGSFDSSNADFYLANVTFRLFGFALEAEKFGDAKSATKARELAESAQALTQQEYLEIHNRRMKNGSFIVAPEDFK